MVPAAAREDLRASLDRIRKVRSAREAVTVLETEIDHLLRVVVPVFVRYPAPIRRTRRARILVAGAGLAAAGIEEIGAYGSALSGGTALPVGAPAAMAAGVAAIALEAYVATSLRVRDLRDAGLVVEPREVAADIGRAMAGLTGRSTLTVTRPLVRAITKRMLKRTGKGLFIPVVGAALSAWDAQSTVVAIRRMPLPSPAPSAFLSSLIQPPVPVPGPAPAGFPLPTVVGHADWSVRPGKRWVAQARLEDGGRYVASAPRPAGPTGPGSRLPDALGVAADAVPGVLAGFDFPIGLPAAYAAKAGIDDFRAALPVFGTGRWGQFFEPAREESEISIERPFFPAGVGAAGNAAKLQAALGLEAGQLFRACDRAHGARRSAAALFLTQGAQQAGKAAIAGWRDLLQPAIAGDGPPVHLWPFDGTLADLLGREGVVVAETYPAEFHHRLGLDLRSAGGKRSQEARAAQAPALLRWAAASGVDLTPELRAGIEDGFGGRAGDDRFDAVVGLFGMLNSLLGPGPPFEPSDPEVRRVEGWMLGLEA
jgi:hypothetical protein